MSPQVTPSKRIKDVISGTFEDYFLLEIFDRPLGAHIGSVIAEWTVAVIPREAVKGDTPVASALASAKASGGGVSYYFEKTFMVRIAQVPGPEPGRAKLDTQIMYNGDVYVMPEAAKFIRRAVDGDITSQVFRQELSNIVRPKPEIVQL